MEGSVAQEYVVAAEKWIASKANTQKVEYVEMNEKKRRLVFQFCQGRTKV